MSELSKRTNEFFSDITQPELEKLLKTIILNPHLKKVLEMRYIDGKDINYIAYETGYSKGKIEADLRKIRKKISKLF